MCACVRVQIHNYLVHRRSVVGVGGPSWQASVMHVCWMQVVGMVGMMLGVDVVFLVVIRNQLHSALSLQKTEINKKIYDI